VKILVVGQDFPWPPMYGSNLRLAQVVKVAASIGDTDFFSFSFRSEEFSVPADIHLNRLETVHTPRPDFSARGRMKWLASAGRPLEISASRSQELVAHFSDWVDKAYDVVWFSKATTFELLGRPNLGPTIVDLDDLEDRKIAARLVAMRAAGPGRGRIREGAAIAQARLNEARWRSLQNKIANEVARVVLCSQLDVSRFSGRNAYVVPNGYEPPEHPAGTVEVGDPPTILLQGSLGYAPNSDAARRLVEEIAPLIRKDFPTARVRLVGEPDGSVTRLDSPPEVTVVGRVPTMEPELARADLIAVPIRFGSGTRVKILEAFAHEVPVVSTTLGAEGLGAEPGVHYLGADDASAFAQACMRLLEDTALRQEITERAKELFLERFQWSYARARIKELMIATAGTA